MTTDPPGPAAASAQPAAAPPGTREFRRGVASVGGGSLIGVAALFVEGVIVARALPITDMGAYVFFQALLALLVIAVDFGFRTTAAQFLASDTDPLRRADLVSSLLILRLLVLAVVSGLVLLATPALTRAVGMPPLFGLMLWMPVVLTLSSLDELLTGMLQGFHRYRIIAVAQVARSLLRLGMSAVILLVLRRGLQVLVWSWIISLAVSVAVQLWRLPGWTRLRVGWNQVRTALRFGMPVQMTRYLWFGMQRVDTFVLTAFTGPAGVAFYDIAGRVPQGLNKFLESYYAVYHPSLSGRFARNELPAATRLMEQSLRLFA